MGTNTDTPTSETIERLVEFIGETEYDDLPESVVETTRWHLLDTVGCGLYGSTLPWIRNLVRSLEAVCETGTGDTSHDCRASVFGAETSLPPARASLVDGTAVHGIEFDDHCGTAGVHAGATVIPPALAFVRSADGRVSGEAFLTAVAIGVEVGVRSGYGIGIGSLDRGFHIAGWTGAFASAAAVGKLHGLDADALGHALGLAGTQGCGLTGAHTAGADAKRLHMGKAAEAGYLSVTLANEGFTGDRRIFEDRRGGVGRSLSGDFDVDAVTAGLGEDYQFLKRLTLKSIPGLGMIHPPIEALEQIVDEYDVDLHDVASVTVGTTEVSHQHGGQAYEPTGIIAAQSNIQYAVASFLVDGTVNVESFRENAIERDAVLDRATDVEVVVDERLQRDHPDGFGAVVSVEMSSGERYEATELTAPGSPENPLSEDELLEKFRSQAGYVLEEDAVDGAIEFITTIETRDDVSKLFKFADPGDRSPTVS